MARAFAQHGARVTIASRNPEHLNAAQAKLSGEGLGVKIVEMDVRDRPRLDAVAEDACRDGVDIVVNNAAGNFPVPFLDMSENAWDAVVNIVLQGTANVSRAFGKRWRENQTPANVVNILAGYAWTGAPLVSHSGAAKAGVMNLTKSLAAEWAPAGIRVNAVSPGPIADTGGASKLLDATGLRDQVLKSIPMDRLGTWQDVANAVMFLSSDAASYLTGSVLVVDGGMDANLWNRFPIPS